MAFTSETPQYALQNEKRPNAPTGDSNAKKRVAYFKWLATDFATQTVTGRIKLTKLPAGPIRILTEESRWFASDAAATAVLDIGYGAHNDRLTGDAVIEDPNYFVTDAAIGAAAVSEDLNESAAGFTKEFDSLSGVDIVADLKTAHFDAADDYIEGYVVYTMGN